MVAKAAVRRVQYKVADMLTPTQLGFGVKMSTEAAVHAARCFVTSLGPGNAMLKIDFTNAFNTVHRDIILETVRRDLPELFNFVETCYGRSSHLIFGEYLLSSDEGVQQGDPMGPLLFSLATFSLAKSMKSELNMWYLDDGCLGGDVDLLISDFEYIKKSGQAFGLSVNESICEQITEDDRAISMFRQIVPNIVTVRPQSACLLGAPIGDSVIIDNALKTKLDNLQKLCDTLKSLNAHDAFFLLKHCFSLPKLLFILRCAPCYQRQFLLHEYDTTIRTALQSILNVQLSDAAWYQAILPVSNGGLGIRAASDIALPAFLSSVVGSAALTSRLLPDRLSNVSGLNDELYISALSDWQFKSKTNLLAPLQSSRQRAWDEPLVKIAVDNVLSTAQTQVGLARLLAVSAPHAGAYLNAIPCSSVGTRLDNTSLRIAIALRLGAPVCEPHTCVCGQAVDAYGTHGLSCRKSAGRQYRHNTVNDIIQRALSSAGVPSRLEPPHLYRDDGKRPDGLTTVPWKNGRCLVWDFTCPDTLAPSHLNHAVIAPGTVAADAERHKQTKYAALSTTYNFVPVAIETFGAFGDEASAFIQDVGRRILAATHEPRSAEFLYQRLSVAIQQGNAACVLGTLPKSACFEELFCL